MACIFQTCLIWLLNNKFHGLSPSGGHHSLLFDQGFPNNATTAPISQLECHLMVFCINEIVPIYVVYLVNRCNREGTAEKIVSSHATPSPSTSFTFFSPNPLNISMNKILWLYSCWNVNLLAVMLIHFLTTLFTMAWPIIQVWRVLFLLKKWACKTSDIYKNKIASRSQKGYFFLFNSCFEIHSDTSAFINSSRVNATPSHSTSFTFFSPNPLNISMKRRLQLYSC